MLSVYVTSQGVRWQLSDDDEVEVWGAPGSELVFMLSGAVMRALVQEHLDGLGRQKLAESLMAPKARVKIRRAPKVGLEAVRRKRRSTRKA